MMKSAIIVLVACLVLAYEFHVTSAQFSFSLPGKWGSGKRSMPWAKQATGECGEFDPEAIYTIYKLVQNEAIRVGACMQKTQEKH